MKAKMTTQTQEIRHAKDLIKRLAEAERTDGNSKEMDILLWELELTKNRNSLFINYETQANPFLFSHEVVEAIRATQKIVGLSWNVRDILYTDQNGQNRLIQLAAEGIVSLQRAVYPLAAEIDGRMRVADSSKGNLGRLRCVKAELLHYEFEESGQSDLCLKEEKQIAIFNYGDLMFCNRRILRNLQDQHLPTRKMGENDLMASLQQQGLKIQPFPQEYLRFQHENLARYNL